MFRKKIKHIIVGVAIGFIAVSYFKSGIFADILDYLEPRYFTVIMGEAKSFPVSNPKTIKIGNPALLDVSNVSSKEILLSGRAVGETMLTVIDDNGRQEYSVKIIQEDLGKLKDRIDILLETAGFPDIATSIGEKENKIFVQGKFLHSKKDTLEKILKPFEGSTINLIKYEEDIPSIEIDVEVLEIEKTALDNLGLTWNQSVAFSEGTVRAGNQFDRLLRHPDSFFQVMKAWRTTPIAATLNILKQRNKARTLSRPQLVCLSGKEANLQVGGERPILKSVKSSTGGGQNNTDYEIEMKDYGVTLKIKPTAKENDEINVVLQTEISEIDDTNSLSLTTSTGTVSTPGFTKRTANTELSVLDGQTVFLAGLIKSKKQDNRNYTPGLSKIPFLGALFRNKNVTLTDTEIVITLTPTVRKNKLDKKEGFVESAETQRPLQGEMSDRERQAMMSREDPLVTYSNSVKNFIKNNLKYPKGMRRQNMRGAVKTSLHILPDGTLLGIVILQSSGDSAFDEGVEYALKQLSPYPTFPSELNLKELWLDIPIVY